MSTSQPSGPPVEQEQLVQQPFYEADDGLHKGLGQRQVQMIAIGSAIGTGLFLGAGGRLHDAGPSLFILYGVCGFFGYLILRALGELIMHRPSSGSFVSYSREFYGEKAAYVAGWVYWLSWAMTAVADGTAIAIYVKWFGQYSEFVASIPQGVLAFVVITLVLAMNLVSVKVFGELEFWFSLIKVGALVIFLIIGIFFVVFGTPTGSDVGFHLITDNGGLLPNGMIPALIVVQGVVFAYSGIELVGTTAGETKDVKKVIPKAINMVIVRIGVFYVGSVLLLCMLLPYTAYSADESPFVTFFGSIGVDAAAPIMQLVVITAALSSLNAGLYYTGRIVHSMAMAGSAPKFTGKLSKSGVPFGGILLTAIVAYAGVVLNFVVPESAFEIVLNVTSLGIIVGWAAIVLSHMKFVSLSKTGVYHRPDYRAPLAPFTDWITLVFLISVVALMALDYPVGTWTLTSSLLLVPILVIGWYAVRRRVGEVAAQRRGFTGTHPVLAKSQMLQAPSLHALPEKGELDE